MKQTTGKTLAKDKIEFVSCLITNKEGNVIIFKRREDLKLDAGKFDFCSGHIKEGEIPMQSMYRELKEETGLNPEQIKLQKVGIIGTPHPKFEATLCYAYYGIIDIKIEKLNEMIKSVEEPELEEAFCLENINALRKEMQQENNNYRTNYTKQMQYFLEAIEQKMNEKAEKVNER